MSGSAEIDDVMADPLVDVLGIFGVILALLDLLKDLIGIFVSLFGLQIRSG